MADGIDTLQEALNGLSDDARLTVEFRFDPAGACKVVEPLRQLRRDVSLEAQVLEHLSSVGAPSGEYRLRVRNKGQHLSQATVELAVREKPPVTPAVTPPVTPAVTPAAAPVTPAVTPANNPAEELGQELLRRTMEHLLAPPPEFDEEDLEEEEPSPLSGALNTLVQSPILAPATARLMDALAGFLEGRTRISDAQARLYEARTRRMGGGTPAPAAAPQRQPIKVRRVGHASTPGGGGSSGSAS